MSRAQDREDELRTAGRELAIKLGFMGPHGIHPDRFVSTDELPEEDDEEAVQKVLSGIQKRIDSGDEHAVVFDDAEHALEYIREAVEQDTDFDG